MTSPGPAHAQASQPWQQRVDYEMDITLLADRHQLRGTQRLTYTNNSPDTLRTVYYHLYFNAFHPNSMMAERNRHLPDPDGRIVPRIFNLDADTRGYHRILSLAQDGRSVDYTIRETVVRVDLAEPIPPNSSSTFEMEFESQVPKQTRRSGWMNDEGIEFSMSQWYPKMAEYDERGWHPDPYVGREFYAPYGTFDVNITAPSEYTLGSTGVLQNPSEVGHGYDQDEGLWRPGDLQTSTDSLTWRFSAEDVHDFAWAADPDYIHETFSDAAGTRYHLLYQPDVEDRWKPMKQWVPDIINFFSEQYGDYPYPQFTVAQAGDGGMEYPMINFLTGKRSPASLLGVTAHEAAHEWFYSALGTNEADYAWMDEGFTSYATTEAVAHVNGRTNPAHTGAFLSVLFAKDVGLLERFNTPADWFQTNLGYGVSAYPGGEMIVEMMSYVIGEKNRDQWLKEYFRRRSGQHPDPFDVEKFAEDVSGLRLDWYFEQFTNTTRPLDYGIESMDQNRTAEGYEVTISLKRHAPVAMPQDIRLSLADGSTQWINIPLVVMHGHKPVPDDWVVAEPWPWTYPEYEVTVTVPAKAERAVLDPNLLTPDQNRLNNTSSIPVDRRFLHPPQQNWDAYSVGWRPMGTYSYLFGGGVGLQSRGAYLFDSYRTEYSLTLYPQVIASNGSEPVELTSADSGTWLSGIDYELSYETPTRALGPRATTLFRSEKKLGLIESEVRVEKPLASYLADRSKTLRFGLLHQYNRSDRVFGARDGLATGGATANPFQQEHTLSARMDYRVAEGENHVHLMVEAGSSLRSTAPSGAATRAMLEARRARSFGPFTAQADLQLGIGTRSLVGFKQFQLGGRSVEAQWQNDAYRTAAAALENPVDDAHLVGFGPAGPVGYLRGFTGSGTGQVGGTRLVAGRLSLRARPLASSGIGLLKPLGVEAFSGIGQAWNDGAFLAGFTATDLVADAGFGVRYNVADVGALRRWTQQSDVLQDLSFVARFPLYVSDPDLIGDQDELAGRWLIGIEL
ncbi:aminopeptidase [Longibacter salinarum]|uniref:Aminopeptidase n=2 Tax=Longibacter salinarum TaxID=1850348 RepID=A0A2A8CZR4_9BACT|nr:aminopeptidase [Longibacter salinarum]